MCCIARVQGTEKVQSYLVLITKERSQLLHHKSAASPQVTDKMRGEVYPFAVLIIGCSLCRQELQVSGLEAHSSPLSNAGGSCCLQSASNHADEDLLAIMALKTSHKAVG